LTKNIFRVMVKVIQDHSRSPKVIYRYYTQMVGIWKRSCMVTSKSRSRSLIRSNNKSCPILRGDHCWRVGGLVVHSWSILSCTVPVFMTRSRLVV
jgi:hypothetical protein